jgi:Second Messenger Oligonucleotide or Dinucleotide Synthetase domain
MNMHDAFDALQTEVNADPEQVDRARERRDLFRTAFGSKDKTNDVAATWPSGSLARGSQIEPIHDVDLIIEYAPEQHPGWGQPGPSAEDALKYLQSEVNRLLGSEGTGDVRLARIQDHAVKCFLDDPEQENAFTVDVVPALARDEGRGFWIPEKSNRIWVETDPLLLVDRVLDRHHESGGQFVPLCRCLKRWSKDNGKPLKGLTLEVLALDHLSDEARPRALAGFFTAAAEAVYYPILDPADLCGDVQPDRDKQGAAEKLEKAGDLAWRAVNLEERGEEAAAQCLWWKVFGDIFPKPDQGCTDDGGLLAAGTAGLASAIPRRRVQDVEQG